MISELEEWSRGDVGRRRDGERGQRSEIGGQTKEILNIEQQNKKPQNDEVIASIFEIPCSTFCGSQRLQLDETLIAFLLTPNS
jgi:hypothetical protein